MSSWMSLCQRPGDRPPGVVSIIIRREQDSLELLWLRSTTAYDCTVQKRQLPELLTTAWQDRRIGLALGRRLRCFGRPDRRSGHATGTRHCDCRRFSSWPSVSPPAWPPALSCVPGGPSCSPRSPTSSSIEMFHLGLAGPTVGAIRLDETFGIIAPHRRSWLLFPAGLVPMALGASLGATLARRLSGVSVPAKGIVAAAGEARIGCAGRGRSASLVLLAVMIALPASTPAIAGTDGKPVPGSIAEVTTVSINGQDRACSCGAIARTTRCSCTLPEGRARATWHSPGRSFTELEQNFTVVRWDEPGQGKSYAGFEPSSKLTFDRAIADTIEVTNYLRDRFNEDKIYLMGESYGTILGVKTVQQRPDLFYAYIGSGQMVNAEETIAGSITKCWNLPEERATNCTGRRRCTPTESRLTRTSTPIPTSRAIMMLLRASIPAGRVHRASRGVGRACSESWHPSTPWSRSERATRPVRRVLCHVPAGTGY